VVIAEFLLASRTLFGYQIQNPDFVLGTVVFIGLVGLLLYVPMRMAGMFDD